MNKKFVGLGLVAAATLTLAACGNRGNSRSAESEAASTDLKVSIVTDTGGVDDRSFNQSAWEGLQAWGKDKGLTKDNGFTYFQSDSESDYANNLEQAATDGYNLVFGVGYALHQALADAAKDHTEVNYVLIDDVVEDTPDNVANILFADHEASYLAGVAAAKTTKTKHVGFVGGVESAIITRFEKGFKAGVESVDKTIKVDVAYAASFSDQAKGKTIADTQYAAGADVIFHASGGTGNGVFAAAKAENETRDEADKVWVIGVDRDQSTEGKYTSKDKKESNFVLASTLKEVGQTVQDIAEKTENKKFPGGSTITYGLKDGGVDLAVTNLSDDATKAVEAAKTDILDGKVTVPEK